MLFKNRVDRAIGAIATSKDLEMLDSISNRFWKLGKRYGKKNFETQPLSGALVTAILTTGEAISEQMLLELTLKGGKLRSMQDRFEFLSQTTSNIDLIEIAEDETEYETDESKPLNASLQSARRNDSKKLDNAEKELKRHREAERIRLSQEKKAQVQNLKKMERDGYRNELQALREQIIILESEYEEIQNLFLQRFETQKDMGLICWARFADGYQIGRSGIRQPGGLTKKRRTKSQERYELKTSKHAPSSIIEVPTPRALRITK